MTSNGLLLCFGTRPEWLKIRPVVDQLLASTTRYDLLFTGQHDTLLDISADDYAIKHYITIAQSSQRLDAIIADVLRGFPDGDFSGVLVQGDTASALACALAAFHRKIPVIHLEAGLRTGDLENPFPEEAYRQMISRITDIHFAPTELSKSNLEWEGVNGEIHVVGNTALDNIKSYRHSHSLEYLPKVVVTLHRRENHDKIHEWFGMIEKLAIDNPNLEFILPIHPNPNVLRWKSLISKVQVVDPMPHHQFRDLLASARLVITDSGGIQEEATFLNKKTIVCRTTTERPEGIATGHLFMCHTPDELPIIFGKLVNDYYINEECPYGDGHSAERIVEILYEKLR